MATITMQRNLVLTLKNETSLNLGMVNKLQAMPPELSRMVFKDNALEKPTQNLFNHLSHYLVSVIDAQMFASLPWPLYDTKTERAYRNVLSNFIGDFSSKGLLSPVMSSYFVNPGCYKMTMLIFQLSQLAVKKMLKTKMKKDHQKKLYNSMKEEYKSQDKDIFIENIEKETEIMLSKFPNYLHKRRAIEMIAEILRDKITKMETKLSSLGAQKYIDDLVDGFLNQYTVDDVTKVEILRIKKVGEPTQFFDTCLTESDQKLNDMESKWTEKISPFLATCKETMFHTQSLIARHTGEADRNSYVIEYNPITDYICTKDLQSQVNSQQKYILKNIVKEDRMNLPNLVRGFLIAICFILKNAEIGDEIYKFNEYLAGGLRNFSEIVSTMRILLERVMNAEAKLQHSPEVFNHSVSLKEFAEIPPLPDLSHLRSSRDPQCQALFDTFTPLSVFKHQFNLHRKTSLGTSVRPKSKSLITSFHQGPRDDFLKSLKSCTVSSYDRPNISQYFRNMSMSQANNRVNETIAECSSGFTKQQILRLLSTKKSSSSKKLKYKTERPDINIKKGGLFNKSSTSNENMVLIRSFSSPNLFENREKESLSRTGRRRLSIMEEHSLLEMSGIVALEKDVSYATPHKVTLERSQKLSDATSIPAIIITPEPTQKFHDFKVDSNPEISIGDSFPSKEQSKEFETEKAKTETPKNNVQLIRKTSSLEKIINRFKKVRASVLSAEVRDEDNNEFKTIVEEKENVNIVNVEMFTANRVLLPDLLSPSFNVLKNKSTDYLDIDEKVRKKPRESLGAALGVDQTYLDQFDLID